MIPPKRGKKRGSPKIYYDGAARMEMRTDPALKEGIQRIAQKSNLSVSLLLNQLAKFAIACESAGKDPLKVTIEVAAELGIDFRPIERKLDHPK